MQARVTLTTASVASTIAASGTFATRTSPAAYMIVARITSLQSSSIDPRQSCSAMRRKHRKSSSFRRKCVWLILVGISHPREECMSIQSALKCTVIALAVVAAAPLFAQGTPINAAAFDALVAAGPQADATTIAWSTWATKVKQAGVLRLGGTQTSNLFSSLNEKDGKIRGFDAGLAQLITRYILGDGSKYRFTQVTSSTREQVLINDQVDVVLATYSIT